jgi:pimeloyl-ACP methyl ester carboxylesterase
MNRSAVARGCLALATTAALLGSAAPVAARPSGALDDPASTTTTATATAELRDRDEARRVDRVPTPGPEWFDCTLAFGPGNECATVDLPLDYDRPRGRTTSVAVLRHPAADQSAKLGTLFVNPGGPGGSGVQMAAAAPFFLGAGVLERFDVVGFDPRGTNFSQNVRCWEHMGTQIEDIRGFIDVPFPVTDEEEDRFVASSEAIGRACASFGDRLVGSMSTAEVARDMDVLRRMVGDEQLTYLGFSYGSYLGTVYANLFPDRVRALAIDGIVDPVAWAGTPETADTEVWTRIGSTEASWKAFWEILTRCGAAGPDFCQLAAFGDPTQVAAGVFEQLLQEPLVLPDPFGGPDFTLTYAILVAFLLSDMYSPQGSMFVDGDLTFVHSLLQERAAPGTVPGAALESARATLLQKALGVAGENAAAGHREPSPVGTGFPYFNGLEASLAVLCTDTVNPPDADLWREHADRAAETAPHFGRLWAWQSAPCASDTWTVRDEDAYTGPYTRPTVEPVLVVGNFWDPATNYDNAVSTAALLPGSRLLSSDSWGHTAYGTSACVTDAVDAYLLSLRLPEPGTVCVGDDQPFTIPLGGPPAPSQEQRRAEAPDRLPPVVPPLPGSVPRG